MHAYRGRRGTAPLIHKPNTRLSTFKFNFLPLHPRGTNQVPLNRRLPELQIQSRHFVVHTHLLLLPGCEPEPPTASGYRQEYRLQRVIPVHGHCLAIGGILFM